jgi:high-affinity Fe2+/Pb2+ permease
MPKYRRAWSGLVAFGLGLVWLSPHSGQAASGWVSEFSLVLVAAGMSVLVAGMIAERRECEAKNNGETNNGGKNQAI